MTEAEWWVVETDPQPMLQYLQGKVSERKLRLFAEATAIRLGSDLGEMSGGAAGTDLKVRKPTTVSITSPLLGTFYGRTKPGKPPLVVVGSMVQPGTVIGLVEAMLLFNEIASEDFGVVVEVVARDGALVEYSDSLVRIIPTPGFSPADYREHGGAMLREVFGNPSRPATVAATWLTSTVVSLARHIEESRDLSAMPILADALQDGGCTQPDILNHCRQPGEHVRGCWVLDAVLGRK